jgi:esterase/lipase superfamily enzyme
MTRVVDRWHSPLLDRTVEVARWGDYGVPVLVFPTAGGDALEIERFDVVASCAPLIEEGRIKVYSCDSINGRAMLMKEGGSLHRSWILRRFVEFIGNELAPAIRADCQSDDIEIITAGASIGAFNALSAVCRYPETFRHAICMSGTFNLERFMDGPFDENFIWASPIHYLHSMDEEHMSKLRRCSIVLASGEGPNEDMGESWHVASVLGSVGVPNRVDPWGPEWAHDWPLWREMLPQYLGRAV